MMMIMIINDDDDDRILIFSQAISERPVWKLSVYGSRLNIAEGCYIPCPEIFLEIASIYLSIVSVPIADILTKIVSTLDL